MNNKDSPNKSKAIVHLEITNNDGEYSDHGFIITKASNMQCNSIYIPAQICCREAKVKRNIWGGQPDIIFIHYGSGLGLGLGLGLFAAHKMFVSLRSHLSPNSLDRRKGFETDHVMLCTYDIIT